MQGFRAGAPSGRGQPSRGGDPIKAHLRLTLVSASLALLLAVGFVVPAFGVPDPLQLADKALDRAKGASKTAKRARKSARKARRVANAAKTKADWSFALAAAGPPMAYLTQKLTVAPLTFGDLTVRCPQGYRVAGSSISPGALIPVSQAVAPTLAIFSAYNASATPYSYFAQLQCIKTARAAVAATSGAGVRRQVDEAKRAFSRSR